jgi:hypothetical protein
MGGFATSGFQECPIGKLTFRNGLISAKLHSSAMIDAKGNPLQRMKAVPHQRDVDTLIVLE